MRQISFNLLYILAAIIFVGTLQPCDDDSFHGEGEGSRITITAATAFSNTTSRAVYEDGDNFTADDIAIENYSFLLFDNNKQLISAFDLGKNDLPYVVTLDRPVSDNVDYSAFLLGNVTLAKLGVSVGDNMSELNAKVYEITRTYNSPKESEKNLFTWSGYLPLKQSTKSLDFMLNPNVAKITATIKNTSTNSRIRSVRIKNVANKVRYAQNALTKSSSFDISNNTTGGVEFIDYDMEDNLDLGQNGQTKISWYVPHNQAGTGNRTDNAPATATYLQIDAVSTADGVKDNNVATCYKVYPGLKADDKQSYAEMTDFNVVADHIYNLNVTISDDGISSDVTGGFMTDKNLATNIIKLPKNSNCYMIHPIGDRIKGGTVYELPIDRINQYWKTIENETGESASDHALTADSKWQVEVVWQDIKGKRAITFCDEYGNALPDKAPGEGLNPFYFKLENTTTDPGSQTYGNVLVGVKKLKSDGTALDGYCWSWHLWITDYNPDAAPAYDGSSKIWQSGGNIDLQGQLISKQDNNFVSTSTAALNYSREYVGEVQHYNSLYDWYWKTNTQSSSVWDGGIYNNKWMMDRNIGSLCSEVGAIKEPLDGWGMYYQYGRKDPFSYKVLYDITGTKTVHSGGETPGINNPQWVITKKQADGFKQAIMNPNHYYATEAEAAWVSGNPPTSNWYSPNNDPMSPNHAKYQKTFFDPCPPGWCVPSANAFYFGKYAYDKSGAVPSGYIFKGPYDKYDSSVEAFKYAKVYAQDLENNFSANSLSNDRYAHTSVTVHTDVNGKYKDLTGVDKTYVCFYDGYIDTYRDPERTYATLYSTTDVGSFKTVRAVFPCQGRITGDGANVGKMGMFGLQSGGAVHKGIPDGTVMPNYPCTTDIQGCVWTADNGGDAKQATLLLFQGVMYNGYINLRNEIRNNRLFLRAHGYMSIEFYLKSRGQNVRCVQEPD